MSNIVHFFSKNEYPSEEVAEKSGIRGQRAIELAKMKMPVLPGMIIDQSVVSDLKKVNLENEIKKFCKLTEKETGKKFGDEVNPDIFKIVISPSLEIVNYPSIHTIGLTDSTIEGFKKMVGEHFAYHEYARFLIKGTLDLLFKIKSDINSKDQKDAIQINELIEKLELPPVITETDYNEKISKKIKLKEEKELLDYFYKKDSSEKLYKLSYDIKEKEIPKVLEILSYIEHLEVQKDLMRKYAYKQLKTIIRKTHYKPDNIQDYIDIINTSRNFLPKEFFSDPIFQLNYIIKLIGDFLKLEDMNDEDSAIIVQPMVYGNYGKDSYSGKFYTRDIVSGENKLQGDFFQNKFDETEGGEALDINSIDSSLLKTLQKIGADIESHHKEIRQVKFTIEKGNLWIIEQTAVMAKSTQADIKYKIHLLNKNIIDEKYILTKIKPEELSGILHPVINLNSVKKLSSIVGGIAGAPGAAVGKVFFSTESLLEAHRKAVVEESNKNFLLCLPATYAEDVKAIEVAKGVISCEGGYSAHASVVARQYGKVSLVKPDLIVDLKNKKLTIGDVTVSEGDYITLDVPYYGTPMIYLGKADLIEPDPKDSGLLDIIEISGKYIDNFKVYGNGDSPKDAELIRKFGGEGIGLCRTEHMFFDKERISVFREMIVSNDLNDRKNALNKLKIMQVNDFYGIFKTMSPYPVTIRLLDAPLHEFLPHTQEEMNDFIKYLKISNPKITKEDVQIKCESIAEVNPMLGHRGCRIAISYPEIYEMQVTAIFEAAYKLQTEGIDIVPEIMVPIVMNVNEMKIVKHGKKIEGAEILGITQIAKKTAETLGAKDELKYKVGTMIELPSAALVSDEIAKYAEFFSFGTNDLTQTTHGLSGDDFNSFLPDYSKFDVIDANPFQVLTEPVKNLISISIERGRLTRPDLKIGLCGEQGADPRNLTFLKNAGLNYVSCSSYSIPIAKLMIAQLQLENE